MKIKDILSKVVINKKNGQLNTSFKKNKMKEEGISLNELMDMKIDGIKLEKQWN